MNSGDAEDYKMLVEGVNYHIIGVVLAQQFRLKDVLNKFGNPGKTSSVKELNQLHDMTTFISFYPKKLTREDRINALSSIMLLVEKRDGTIEARTCADGSKQRRDDSYNKNDYAYPTCANNSVMITSALEAKEGRDVAIIYIPGAYLHTYVDKHGKKRIIMLFKGELEDLMVMVDQKL